MLHRKKYRKTSEKKPAEKHRRCPCGKIRYASLKEANRAAQVLIESGVLDKNKEGVFEGYYSKRCRCYHTGHNRMKVVA